MNPSKACRFRTLFLSRIDNPPPKAVNYHFSRKCNYKCEYCFHTSKPGRRLRLDQSKELIRMLSDYGVKKINFAGGEPSLYLKELSAMLQLAHELGMYTSIISNGSHLTKAFLEEHTHALNMLGLSCDTADDELAAALGRGKGAAVKQVRTVADYCHELHIPLKINTVVTAKNQHDDMSALINTLEPQRWKIFQVLPLDGENTGEGALRDVSPLLITSDQYQAYVERHRQRLTNPSIMKVEDNSTMRDSYYIIDEQGRLLDTTHGAKQPTRSILDIGCAAAFNQFEWDVSSFMARDGAFFIDAPQLAPQLALSP